MKRTKRIFGILLSLLMVMQLLVVPASAAQKLSTPTGFRVVNDYGDLLLDYSDSTPAQYVDHYLVYFYAISGGVVYDPGYRGEYNNSELYMEDILMDYESILEEFEYSGTTLVNPKLAMRAQAISNDPNACSDSDMSIYFGQNGQSLESEITYLAGGSIENGSWKLTKDYELIISGTGEVDAGWLYGNPDVAMAKKVIIEDGITICWPDLYNYPMLREVYVYDEDFEWAYSHLGASENTVVYISKNSPYFQEIYRSTMDQGYMYGSHYADIADEGENFRYTVNEDYVDAAKIVSDMGILPFVYIKRNDNITKSELAVAFARLQVRGLFMDKNRYYSDLEANSFESGAANEYIDVLLPESDTVYGKDIEITYQNVLDLVAANFPAGTVVSIPGKSAGSKVNQQELAYLFNQLLTPNYLMKGTEDTLYVFQGSISDVYCDPDNYYQYYGTLNGTLLGDFDIVDEEIIENYDALIMDYDGLGLTDDDDITLYIVYNEVRTGVLSTYDIEKADGVKYSASFTINNGAAETSNRNVTLQLAAEGYTKYRIGDGAYRPITPSVSYTLTSAHGEQTISVTFANADETKKKTVTNSIRLNNLHTVTYMVDGAVWRTEQVGCGLPIPELTVVPEKVGMVFDSWLNMPTVMPDSNVTVTAKFTDVPPVGQGTCGENASWVLHQNGTLTITGTGVMDTGSYPEYMSQPYNNQIKKVVISEGITEIGDYMVYELFEMEEISIPSTVTRIGAGFVKGSKVTSVTIPATVQTVNMDMSFVKCEQLSEIVVPGKDTVLDFSSGIELISGVTIYGYTNSGADVYATYNNCNFVAIDPDFVINDGAEETTTADVTIKFNSYALDFDQYKLGGGAWKNMTETISYTLDSADGEKNISIVFKKGDLEIEKTHTIVYNNKHNIIYKVNGTDYLTEEFGCGAAVTVINQVPTVPGYVFIGWDALPEVMPDNDIICNAILAELPQNDVLQGVLTEEEVNDGYTASAQIAVTTASSDMQTAIDNKSDYAPALILDITLEKVKEGEQPQPITETDSLVAFEIDIPQEVQGNFTYVVLREHNGVVDTLTERANANGEYVKFENGKLTIYANRFSTYTLLAKEIVRTGGLGTAGISGCTVRFEENGGSSVASQSLSRGSKAEEPEAPVKDGYIFDGWYQDSELTEKFNFNTVINKTLTLYAKWIEAPKAEIILAIGDKTATVNGEAVTNDVAPVIVNDRTMLPIRFIAEALGATVGWDKATKTATVELGDITISIVIGEDFATVNGEKVELDAPSFIQDSRTFLPIRFVMENIGATVEWNDGERTVTITK